MDQDPENISLFHSSRPNKVNMRSTVNLRLILD
jgi:hypothetical protein